MKQGLLIIGILLAMPFANAEEVKTSEVYLAINEVFIPDAAKANGDSYVVVNGMFPNSCYSWKGPQITNKSAVEHEIRLVATVRQTMCLMVLVPFSREVVLGPLTSGTHTLRFVNGDGTYFERTMSVP